MFKLFKKTFKTTNESIILATPLVLFMWILSLYISYSKEVVDTLPEIILSAVTMLFMTSAFCSGWFYMVKKSVEFAKKDFILDTDKASEALKLIKTMPTGVGKHFLTYVGVSLLFLMIALFMAFIIKILSYPYVKSITALLIQSGIPVNSPQEINVILDTLSQDKLYNLFLQILSPSIKLFLIVMIIPTIFSFSLMLWMPEIIYRKTNAVLSLFTSIKKVFVKFRKSVILFIYLTFIQMTISFLGTFSILNPITYMIMMIIYFYFIVYVIVLVFSYYDEEFNEKDGAGKTESDSDSRCDS